MAHAHVQQTTICNNYEVILQRGTVAAHLARPSPTNHYRALTLCPFSAPGSHPAQQQHQQE